jgi:hypothetical protein
MEFFIETFPVLVAFENLDLLENLQIAKKAINGLSGIYAFVHIPTGTSYIGSSMDLCVRIMDHILNHSSNPHLQSAILKYGLSSFVFVILQYCNSSDLLKLEQYFLDILFSLPVHLRYNFLPSAGSPLGVVRSEETRANMSKSQQLVDRSGANNPMSGKVPANAFQSGDNNPISIQVYVYSAVDNVLVRSFPSQSSCSEWLSVNQSIVSKYIKSGKVWKELYVFRNSSL